MANDPKNIRLGASRVRWGGIDLGLTKGGVEVEVTTSTKEVQVDQFGETPVNEYIMGRKITIKTPFAETDLDTMSNLLRGVGGTLVDDGVKASGTIVFAANPVANDTVTVAGVVFKFVATPAALRDVKLGATASASLLNLFDMLVACTDAGFQFLDFSITNPTTITVTYRLPGVAGNAIAMAKSGTAPTVSATLTGGTASTRRRMEMTNGVGLSLLDGAKELVLRPIDRADNDFSEDFVVPLAATSGALQFAYKLDEERIFNLTFTGYPNTATRLLFLYGDKRST